MTTAVELMEWVDAAAQGYHAPQVFVVVGGCNATMIPPFATPEDKARLRVVLELVACAGAELVALVLEGWAVKGGPGIRAGSRCSRSTSPGGAASACPDTIRCTRRMAGSRSRRALLAAIICAYTEPGRS